MANKMERFTQGARNVLTLAEEEAERLHHNTIGTEHLLLGLMREEGGVAGRVLRDLGLEQRRVEELVERMTRATPRTSTAQLDLSPDTKRVLELAVDEARRMGNPYIGTEQLLLALVRHPEGIAIDVLKRLGVSPDEVRRQTRRVLQEPPDKPNPPAAEKEQQRDISAAVSLIVRTKLLPKLLSHLSQTLEGSRRGEMRTRIEELFRQVLAEQSISLTEDERERLLEDVLAPFEQIDESKRTLRLVIADKTTGETYAEISMAIPEVRQQIQKLLQALNEGRTGKLMDISDDDSNNIMIFIDEQKE